LRRDGEATLKQLEHLFGKELPTIVDESRRVLIYFAGHGVATNSIENPQGYLVPADGGEAIDSLLPMEWLGRALDALRCRHLLLILDCCFAGAFRWSTGRDVVVAHVPEMYRERYELFLATPAWQVITSAAYDEKAADLIAGMMTGQRPLDASALHSPFFWHCATELKARPISHLDQISCVATESSQRPNFTYTCASGSSLPTLERGIRHQDCGCSRSTAKANTSSMCQIASLS